MAQTRAVSTWDSGISSIEDLPPTGYMKRVLAAAVAAVFCFGFFSAATLADAADDPDAIGVYQTPDAFIAQAFDGTPPAAATLWLRGELKQRIADIMAHRYTKLRLRYWLSGERSAWVLEEIGKEKPITIGLVVNDGVLEQIKVLIYRESRGWEVRYPFFLEQFSDARLRPGDRLDRSIDGISGATLSVRALTKLARLALMLHGHVTQGES